MGLKEESKRKMRIAIAKLEMIEITFESGNGFYSFRPFAQNPSISVEKFNECVEFRDSLGWEVSASDVLKAIMKNIIKNKGEFIPTEKEKAK